VGVVPEFYPHFDYTIPEQTKVIVTDEAHTIPTSSPHHIFLRHIPRQQTPSTVSIPGFTEVTSEPGPGQFRVMYGEAGFGRILFHEDDGDTQIDVSYQGAGSVIWAESYDGGNRQGINHIQDTLEAHVTDTENPHDVTALQAGAIPNTPNAVGHTQIGVMPAAMARGVLSGEEELASNTDRANLFSAAEYDTDNMWSTSQRTRLTINTPGIYVVSANVDISGNEYGVRMRITKNEDAVTLALQGGEQGAGIIGTIHSCSVVHRFSAGEFIEMRLMQVSGSPVVIFQHSIIPHLSATWISAAP
jgi:hypothetical protein